MSYSPRYSQEAEPNCESRQQVTSTFTILRTMLVFIQLGGSWWVGPLVTVLFLLISSSGFFEVVYILGSLFEDALWGVSVEGADPSQASQSKGRTKGELTLQVLHALGLLPTAAQTPSDGEDIILELLVLAITVLGAVSIYKLFTWVSQGMPFNYFAVLFHMAWNVPHPNLNPTSSPFIVM